jgi:hypothetical protein
MHSFLTYAVVSDHSVYTCPGSISDIHPAMLAWFLTYSRVLSVFTMVEQIFGMLHAVKTLDISQGSHALFSGLCSATVYTVTDPAL